jgi:putative DNA primase/helicase
MTANAAQYQALAREAVIPLAAAIGDTFTDSGNAARLVGLHGSRLRYIPAWGRWAVAGEDGFWKVDQGDVMVRELGKDVGQQLKIAAAQEKDQANAQKVLAFAFRSLNTGGINGMVNLARGIEGIPLDHELLDADGMLLGTENGVIDLRTGEHRPADPQDLITMRCPVPWEPDAVAPRFEQCMVEWFPDPEVRAYVQRVAGAALVGGQRDHAFIIHYGGGGNGKGTYIRALQKVLGAYSVEAHLSLLIDSRQKEHDTVKADLFRARLAIATETERRVRLAEASVKNLTGGDRIRARRMREDPWSFDPTHSLWLQTNHLPEIHGRDAGIWRRIRVVKWVASFKGKTDDRSLGETLASEAAGILRWMVRGCLEWQRLGLSEPEAVVRDTLEYRSKEDTFASFAEDVGLTFANGLQIPAGELQKLLSDWADSEGRERPEGVVEWLEDRGARRTQQRFADRSRRKVWLNVGLTDL